MKRPGYPNTRHTTPSQQQLNTLLGDGVQCDGVTLSRDEFRSLRALYDVRPEEATIRPPRPEPPDTSRLSYDEASPATEKYKRELQRCENWTDPALLLEAGSNKNVLRHAMGDGLRMVAWLAQHVEPGQDPMKALVQMASAAGYDVDPMDVEWAIDVDDDDEGEPE